MNDNISKIYHGGSTNRGGGFSAPSGDHFTLLFTNYDFDIVTNNWLRVPDKTSVGSGQQAHHSADGFTIKKVSICIHKFVTNAVRSLTIEFRRYIADGSKASIFGSADGSLLGQAGAYSVLNTGGAGRYYLGFYSNVTWPVVANQAIFCFIKNSTIDDLDGISLWLHCVKL